MMTATMNRLETVLPEWTRRAWVSHPAKTLWEPRIVAIGEAWDRAEITSIAPPGVRSGALRFCDPSDLPELMADMASRGLTVVVLGKAPVSTGSYSSTGSAWEGGAFTYRIAITLPEYVGVWVDAWTAGDDEKIGKLLGFPECCRAFFQRCWVDEDHVDTSWSMAVETVLSGYGKQAEERFIEIPGDVVNRGANILLRWVGVRAVPHLPCSFNCVHTTQLADRMFAVMDDAGDDQEADWLAQLLDMPVEWSALHGIAEIKTPLFTISSRTDLTPEKYVVRRLGSRYPEEGATGLRFPYQSCTGNTLTEGKSFAAAIATFKRTTEEAGPSTLWTDNGFSSKSSMYEAHAVIKAAFDRHIERTPIPEDARVLDLGCGNGNLVRMLLEGSPQRTACGRDTNLEAVQRASVADSEGEWSHGDIRVWSTDDDGKQYNVVLFMPGRLDEWTEEEVTAFLKDLGERTSTLLLYCYGDWVQKGGLQAIFDRHPAWSAQWSRKAMIQTAPYVEAVVVNIN